MGAFKQFCEQWRHAEYESPRAGRRRFSRHHEDINGHHVYVEFNSGSNNKHYNVNFEVNHSYNVSGIKDRATRVKVARHITNKISEFVKDRKPEGLTFQTKSDRKAAAQNKFAHHLAKAHGGTVEYHEPDETTSMHRTHIKF